MSMKFSKNFLKLRNTEHQQTGIISTDRETNLQPTHPKLVHTHQLDHQKIKPIQAIRQNEIFETNIVKNSTNPINFNLAIKNLTPTDRNQSKQSNIIHTKITNFNFRNIYRNRHKTQSMKIQPRTNDDLTKNNKNCLNLDGSNNDPNQNSSFTTKTISRKRSMHVNNKVICNSRGKSMAENKLTSKFETSDLEYIENSKNKSELAGNDQGIIKLPYIYEKNKFSLEDVNKSNTNNTNFDLNSIAELMNLYIS